jgi:hypothetical protein
LDVIALRKPILENFGESDPSSKNAAAQSLLDRIAETEVEYPKALSTITFSFIDLPGRAIYYCR